MPALKMEFVVYQKENGMWSWKAVRGKRIRAHGEREFKSRHPAVADVSNFVESVERDKRHGRVRFDEAEEGQP